MTDSQDEIDIKSDGAISRSRNSSQSPTTKFRRVEIRIDNDDGPMDVENRRSPYFMSRQPLSSYASSREAVLRHKANSRTLEETHVIKNEGIQDLYFTEEHWSSEIKSFVTTTPPKFVQVIKAYRVLSTDRLTLVVEVLSDPPAIFEWFCNDRAVTQDRRHFVVRHSVNVTTLTVEGPEQGVFSCSARNPAGVSKSYGYVTVDDPKKHKTLVTETQETQETEYLVTDVKEQQVEKQVKKPPKFLNQVPHLSVKPGAEAVIDVEVESSSPVKFLWYVNGKLIYEGMQNIEFYYPKPTRCLVLFKLPESGQYTVVAQNEHGVSKCSGYIEVEKDSSSQTHLHLLQSHQKTYLAPQPPGAQRGTSNGATLTRQVIETTTYVQRSSSLPRSHGEHQQTYETDKHLSTSTNDLRESTFRQSRSPDTKHQGYIPQPPAFVTQLPGEIVISPNEKLVLTAEVNAVPAADIKWDINGFEIRRSKNYSVLNENNRSTLVVHPPVKQGRYKVAATNELGKTSFQTLVHTVHTEQNVIQEQHWQQQTQQPPEFIENVTVVKTSVENEDVLDDDSDNSSAETVKMNETGSEQGEVRATSSLRIRSSSGDRQAEFPQKPLIVGHPAAEVLVPGGEPLVLEIKVVSVPEATITWYHKNFEIKAGDRVDIDIVAQNHSRLTVHNPPEGLYKAMAANEHGSIIYEVHVYTEFVDETAEQGIFTRKSVERSIPPVYRLGKRGSITQKQDLPKPPKIISRFQEVYRRQENQELVLEVQADSIPEATFQWRQNNFEVKQGENVKIERPGSNQSRAVFLRPVEGRYDVIAKNDLGQDSASTKVIIDYDQVVPSPRVMVASPKALETPTSPHRVKSPFDDYPIFLQALPAITVIQGEHKMVVVVQTKEPGTFRWFANGEELINSNEHQIINEDYKSTLIIRCKVLSNSEYAVEFTNSYGIIHSMTTVISQDETMEESAQSMEASGPSLITVVEKQDLAKNVKEEGFEKVTEKGSKRVAEEKVIESAPQEPKRILVVEQKSESASLTEKEAESIASEIAANPPRFIEILSVPQLTEGQTLESQVTLAMDTPPCTFSWYLNNKQVDEKYITSGDHNSKIQIPSITTDMGGLLLVIAQNNQGKTESSMHFIVEKLGEKSVKIIEDSMLTSPRSQVHDEITIQKMEEDFTETTNIQKREETYSILVKVAEALAENLVAKICLEAVREAAHHLANAETEEEEEEEEEEDSHYQSVAENFAPVFEISKETYNVAPGENVTIHTKIIGQPCDSVSWYHNGVKMEDSKNITIITTDGHTQLVMKGVTKNQSGTYHCRAENDYGDAMYTCILNISDSMSDSMTSSFITDYEMGETAQTVYSTVGVKHKEEDEKISAVLKHKPLQVVKFSINLAEQGPGIISYGIIKTISIDRTDSFEKEPTSPKNFDQDIVSKKSQGVQEKSSFDEQKEARIAAAQRELEELIPKEVGKRDAQQDLVNLGKEGVQEVHEDGKKSKLQKQAKLDITQGKEAIWPPPEPEMDIFQQGIEVQEELGQQVDTEKLKMKEKVSSTISAPQPEEPKTTQENLQTRPPVEQKGAEVQPPKDRPKSTTSDDLPIMKLEQDAFIDTTITAVPSSPVATTMEELPSPKPVLSPKEATIFQLPSPPMSPDARRKIKDVEAEKKTREALEKLGFDEEKSVQESEKPAVCLIPVEEGEKASSAGEGPSGKTETSPIGTEETKPVQPPWRQEVTETPMAQEKPAQSHPEPETLTKETEAVQKDGLGQPTPAQTSSQQDAQKISDASQKPPQEPEIPAQPIPIINLIQPEKEPQEQQTSSLLIVKPTQQPLQEPLQQPSPDQEIANVEILRPSSAYDFQLTVFEPQIFSDELDLIAVNIRNVEAGSPTSVQISPLEKSDAEDEGLGEETIGLVINIEQPSPHFSHDLTIVEAQPAEINQLKASETFEREAEVIQPKYIKLMDNQTDGDSGVGYASSSIKNIQRMFVFEKDEQEEKVETTILIQSDNLTSQAKIKALPEIIIKKSTLEEEAVTRLVRRDEKPADAETFVEIYRPESFFTYDLTIVTPQMYIGFADIVGNMVMNEMIINVVEELTKEPSQEDKEIILSERAKIRTNVSYKWILSRKDGETHKKDVWTLQRVEQVDALVSDTTATTNVGISYAGEEHQITEVSMLEPSHLLTQVLSEIQKSHSSSEMFTAPEEPTQEKPEKQPSKEELSKSQDLISETTTSDIGQIPTFRKGLDNITLKIGESGQLKCIVTGIPTPEVVWFVDGDQIIPNDEYNIVYEDGVSILIFSKVIAEDEGEYVCEAYNSVGKSSTKCFVKVQDPLIPPDEPEDMDSMKKLSDNFILRKIKRLHKDDRSQSNRDSQHSSASANFSPPSDPESEKWFYVHPIVEATESFIIYRYFDAEYLYHSIPIRSDYEQAELFTSLYEAKIKVRRRSITDTPITNAEVKAIFENGYVDEPWPEHETDTMIRSAPGPEPRSPTLPNKIKYKGTPVELSVAEKNDRLSISTITPDQAGRMSPLQLYIESLCDFSQMFNDMNKTVQEKKIELLKKAKKVKDDKKLKKSILTKSTESDTSIRSSQPILTRSNSQCHQAKIIEITQEWKIDKDPEFGEAAALFWPSITDSIMELSKHSKRPRESKSQRKQSAHAPDTFAPIHRVQSPAFQLHANKSQSPTKKYVSDEDYNYLKKTVEQVQQELDEARTQYKKDLDDEAAKIERMIFEISEQLTQKDPVSRAQAEVSEEILRTRLAEMILNLPHEEKYIDPADNYEALKEPIGLLKEKLGKLEQKLILDEEESIKEELRKITEMSEETQQTEPIQKRQASLRLRKENIARMTPLITVVKDKLTSLEDVVDDKTEHDLARRSGKTTPIDNRKIIHDLLLKINDEINEIHRLCRQNKELDCLNTVIDVLSKVCTYIDGILDTLRVWKKDAIVVYNPMDGEVADVTVDIKKEEEEEITNTLVMYTSGSEKSCLSTNVNLMFSKTEEILSISYAHHSHKPCLHTKVGQDLEEKSVPGVRISYAGEKPPTPTSQRKGITVTRARVLEVDQERSPPRDRQEPRAPTPPPHRQPPPRPPPPARLSVEGSPPRKIVMESEQPPQVNKIATARSEQPSQVNPPPRPPPPARLSVEGTPPRKTVLESQINEKSEQPSQVNQLPRPPPPTRSSIEGSPPRKPVLLLSEQPSQMDQVVTEQPSQVNQPSEIVVEVPFVQTPPSTIHNAVMDVSVNLRRRGDHQKADYTWPISVINMQMSQYLFDDNSVQMICEETDTGNDTDTTSALFKGSVHLFPTKTGDESDVLSAISDDSPIPCVKFGYPEKEVPKRPSVDSTKTLKNLGEEKSQIKQDVPPTQQIHQPGIIVEVPYIQTTEPETASKPPKPPIQTQTSTQLQVPYKQDDDEVSVSISENVPILFAPRNKQNLKETAILSDEDDSASIFQVTNVRNSWCENFSIYKRRRNFRVTAMLIPEQRAEAEVTLLGDDFQVDVERISDKGRDSVVIFDEEYVTSEASLREESPIARKYRKPDYTEDVGDDDVFFFPRNLEYGNESFEEPILDPTISRMTISISARSVKDSVYVQLEEIPWTEASITLVADEADETSETKSSSLLFNVIVAENSEEGKSQKSLGSHRSSQKSLALSDKTLSQQSLNIPTYVIKLGATASITCELNNHVNKQTEIEWFRGKTPLHEHLGKYDRISHDLLEVLIIQHVNFEDSELYSIKVNGELYPVAYIIVEDTGSEDTNKSTKFITPPQTMFVMEGQTAILSCQMSEPNLNVSWYKEGELLEENERRRFQTTSSGWYRAIIENANVDDQGTYYVTLEENSTSIALVVEEKIDEKEVIVSGADTDDEELADYLVPPGSTATIACELESTEFVQEFSWQKNSRDINTDKISRLEHVVNGLKHYLIIHNAHPSDSGVYSVRINDARFKVAHITINHDAPHEVEETTVPEGNDVTIKCETLNEQENIIWCKNGDRILPSGRFSPESSADNHRHYLKIKNVSIDDSGEYGILIDETYISVTKISVIKEDSIITSSIQEDLEDFEQIKIEENKAIPETTDWVEVNEKQVEKVQEILEKEERVDFEQEQEVEEVVEEANKFTEVEHKQEPDVEKERLVTSDGDEIQATKHAEKYQPPQETQEPFKSQDLQDSFVQSQSLPSSSTEYFDAQLPVEEPFFDQTTSSGSYMDAQDDLADYEMLGTETSTEPGEFPEDIEDMTREIQEMRLSEIPEGSRTPTPEKVEDLEIVKAMEESVATVKERPGESPEIVEEEELFEPLEEIQKPVDDVEPQIPVIEVELVETPKDENQEIQPIKPAFDTLTDILIQQAIQEAIKTKSQEPDEFELLEHEEKRYSEDRSSITTDIEMIEDLATLSSETIGVNLVFTKESVALEAYQVVPKGRNVKLTTWIEFKSEGQEVGCIEEVQQQINLQQQPQQMGASITLIDVNFDDEISASEESLSMVSSTSSTAYSPPEFIIRLEEEYQLRPNVRMVFKCTYIGFPLPHATWKLNGNVLKKNKNIEIITEDGITLLIINEIDKSWDQGELICEIRNPAGMSQCGAALKVSEPAEEEGGFAISQVEQYGEASVYLFGEENRIDTNPNGNMDFVEVIDDEMTYSISSTSTTTSMSTIKPVFVTTLPAKLYVKENDNIYLKCSYKGSPYPTIQWKKNGNLIGNNNKYRIIDEDGVTILYISYVEKNDNALFTCDATNAVGIIQTSCFLSIETEEPPSENKINLEVFCDKEMTDTTLEVVVADFEPIQCALASSWYPTHVMEVDRDREHSMSTDSDVTITQELVSDRFSLSSSEESHDEEGNLKQKYQQKPVFIKAIEDLSVNYGQNLRLKTIVNGAPTPNVRWVVESKTTVNKSEMYEDGIAILELENITDNLVVKCIAYNIAGETTCKAKITVENIPIQHKEEIAETKPQAPEEQAQTIAEVPKSPKIAEEGQVVRTIVKETEVVEEKGQIKETIVIQEEEKFEILEREDQKTEELGKEDQKIEELMTQREAEELQPSDTEIIEVPETIQIEELPKGEEKESQSIAQEPLVKEEFEEIPFKETYVDVDLLFNQASKQELIEVEIYGEEQESEQTQLEIDKIFKKPQDVEEPAKQKEKESEELKTLKVEPVEVSQEVASKEAEIEELKKEISEASIEISESARPEEVPTETETILDEPKELPFEENFAQIELVFNKTSHQELIEVEVYTETQESVAIVVAEPKISTAQKIHPEKQNEAKVEPIKITKEEQSGVEVEEAISEASEVISISVSEKIEEAFAEKEHPTPEEPQAGDEHPIPEESTKEDIPFSETCVDVVLMFNKIPACELVEVEVYAEPQEFEETKITAPKRVIQEIPSKEPVEETRKKEESAIIKSESVQEPVPEPVQESIPVQEPVPVQKPVAEPVQESVPVQEPVPEPVQEPAPEPVAEPVQEPVPEPVQEPAPVQEPVPEPVQESVPIQASEHAHEEETKEVQEIPPEKPTETKEEPKVIEETLDVQSELQEAIVNKEDMVEEISFNEESVEIDLLFNKALVQELIEVEVYAENQELAEAQVGIPKYKELLKKSAEPVKAKEESTKPSLEENVEVPEAEETKKKEESMLEEIAKVELVTDEVGKEESRAEELAKEEPVAEKVSTEEPVVDEIAKEEQPIVVEEPIEAQSEIEQSIKTEEPEFEEIPFNEEFIEIDLVFNKITAQELIEVEVYTETQEFEELHISTQKKFETTEPSKVSVVETAGEQLVEKVIPEEQAVTHVLEEEKAVEKESPQPEIEEHPVLEQQEKEEIPFKEESFAIELEVIRPLEEEGIEVEVLAENLEFIEANVFTQKESLKEVPIKEQLKEQAIEELAKPSIEEPVEEPISEASEIVSVSISEAQDESKIVEETVQEQKLPDEHDFEEIQFKKEIIEIDLVFNKSLSQQLIEVEVYSENFESSEALLASPKKAIIKEELTESKEVHEVEQIGEAQKTSEETEKTLEEAKEKSVYEENQVDLVLVFQKASISEFIEVEVYTETQELAVAQISFSKKPIQESLLEEEPNKLSEKIEEPSAVTFIPEEQVTVSEKVEGPQIAMKEKEQKEKSEKISEEKLADELTSEIDLLFKKELVNETIEIVAEIQEIAEEESLKEAKETSKDVSVEKFQQIAIEESEKDLVKIEESVHEEPRKEPITIETLLLAEEPQISEAEKPKPEIEVSEQIVENQEVSYEENDVEISLVFNKPLIQELIEVEVYTESEESAKEQISTPRKEISKEALIQKSVEETTLTTEEELHPSAEESVQEPAQEPVPEPVQEPASEPVAEPVQESVPEPVQESVPEPVQESVPVQEPALELVQESVPEPVQESAPELVQESVPEPVQEPAPKLAQESVPVQESVLEPVQEPAPEPVQEPAPEDVEITLVFNKTLIQELIEVEVYTESEESAKEQVSAPKKEISKEVLIQKSVEETTLTAEEVLYPSAEESAQEPAQESVPEPVQEPAPVQKPVPGPVQEPAPEPVQESAPEPVQEPAPELAQESYTVQEPASEPVAEPVQESAPEPVQEPASEPVAEPVQEPVPEPVQEPAPEPVQEPAPVQKPVPEPVQESVPEPVQEPAPEDVEITLVFNKTLIQELIEVEVYTESEESAKEQVFAPKKEISKEVLIQKSVEETTLTAEEVLHPSAEESVQEPAQESVPEPVQEPAPEPVQEPAPEPVQEPAPEPVQEPAPVQKPVPEPVQEPVPEPVQEPAPEPVQEPAPEPVQEPAPVQK
uniref:Ig-like domain-containing protein n=1 Tax=Acrobeloides nanus TaxID=290746 RepID=A0A914C898_9BILA